MTILNYSILLLGVVPLIAFIILDSFAGVKAGIIAAVFFAIAELVYTLIIYKELDNITFFSISIILIFAALTYYTENSLYFKLQPVCLGLIFGVVFLVMHVIDKPLLVILTNKYRYMLPTNMQEMIIHPAIQLQLSNLSLLLGWGFLIHSGFIAYSVFYLSNWWWLAIRGIGLYVMMGLCIVINRYLI